MHDKGLLWRLPIDMPARQSHYSCSWKVYYKIGYALQRTNVGSWQSCTLPAVRLSYTVTAIYLLLWSDPQQTCLNTDYLPLHPRSHPAWRKGLRESSRRANNSQSDESTWNHTRKHNLDLTSTSNYSSNPPLFKAPPHPTFLAQNPPASPSQAPLLQEILSFLPQTRFLGWLQSLFTKCLEECNGNRKIMFWFL